MFFAHDPGGAQSIVPLLPEFSNSLVFAKGPALSIIPYAQELPENVLDTVMPDFLITGTSADDFTERLLWNTATAMHIPSMAILDSWINYGVRFSKYGTESLHLFSGKCDYLPKYVCVPDEIAKKEMIKDGVPESVILTFGNPHFEYIAARKRSSVALCASVSDGKKTILFASQPFNDIYRNGSELIVLNDLIEVSKSYSDVDIRIRKHPKESPDKFVSYLSNRVTIDLGDDIINSIAKAEIIVSVNSMVLIEAAFLNKKIISYQPRSKSGKDDFILTKNGTLPFISCIDEFRIMFDELIKKENYSLKNKIKHIGVINQIKTFVEEQLYVTASN